MSQAEDNVDHELDSEVILRTSDTVRARIIADLLASQDIPCSTPGLEHLSLMPFNAAIAVVIRVPHKYAAEAKALIAVMESEVEAEPEEVPSAYRESAKKPAVQLSPRLKRAAAMAAFVFPGGAHFYVQQYVSALTVIVGYVATIGITTMEVPLGVFTGLLVLAGDITGAAYHCDVAREGKASSKWRRFAPMLALAFTAAWAPLAMGPLLPLIAGHNARVVCDYVQRCRPSMPGADTCLMVAANGRLRRRLDAACAACLEANPECHEPAPCHVECWEREGTAP